MRTGRLLVVEDEGIIANMLAFHLKRVGYEVVGTAATGEEAVEIAVAAKPDLILMDIRLAGAMDGIQAADEIHKTLDVPVVFLTAYSDDATLQRAKITTPFGYIMKPFNERELLASVEIALYKQRMDHAARERERWLRTVLTSIGDGVIAVDAAGLVRFMNPLAELLSGVSFAEIEGRRLSDVLRLSCDTDAAWGPVTTALTESRRCELPPGCKLVGAYGSQIAVEGVASPIQGEDGKPTGAVLVFRDVTERLMAEETFRKLSQVVEQTADLVMVTDRHGRIEYVNPAFEVFTGYPSEEALGSRPTLVKSDLHDQEFYCEMWNTILSGQTYRNVLVNRARSGSIYYEEKTISPLRDNAGQITHFISTGRDVTDRVLADKAAAESREQLQQIAAALHALLFNFDLKTRRFTHASGSAGVSGFTPEQLVEDSALGLQYVPELDLQRIYKEIDEAMHAGRSLTTTVRFYSGVGERWLRVMGSPMLDDGRHVFRGIILDVTEQKALESRADTAGKLAVLGLLSAGIAHELNNPLASISARVQRLKLHPSQELWNDSVDFFEKQLQRMTGVIRRITAFSRLQSGRVENCNIDKLVTETVELVRLDPRSKSVSIEAELQAGLRPVPADMGHIVHALINLMTNALDALAGSGRVLIRVEQNERICKLTVTDDGPGIPANVRERVFEPFVSTKDQAKGMGLGLYLSRSFIESCGGRIYLERSQPGETVFAIELPFSPQAAHASRIAH